MAVVFLTSLIVNKLCVLSNDETMYGRSGGVTGLLFVKLNYKEILHFAPLVLNDIVVPTSE